MKTTYFDSQVVPTGWCSWYHFFSNISDSVLLNNIHTMTKIRNKHNLSELKLFQIDDGYQQAWGDWLTLDMKKFPYYHSMKPIVEKIEAAGFIPGLWMVCVICVASYLYV